MFIKIYINYLLSTKNIHQIKIIYQIIFIPQLFIAEIKSK